MKKEVIINFRMEAFHKWENAFEEVKFLSHLHRHEFYFTLTKEVEHNDRDIEIILFKRKVMGVLNEIFFDTKLGALNFKNMSCESIAEWLLDIFDLEEAVVLEDNENGARVRK